MNCLKILRKASKKCHAVMVYATKNDDLKRKKRKEKRRITGRVYLKTSYFPITKTKKKLLFNVFSFISYHTFELTGKKEKVD